MCVKDQLCQALRSGSRSKVCLLTEDHQAGSLFQGVVKLLLSGHEY